jgi:hypothetical protein
MKGNVVSCVVVLIGLVALSPTGAQAGGASGVATLTAFFVCQNINGANVDDVVTTQDFDGTVINSNIRVGNGVLFCQQVNVTDSTGPVDIPSLAGDVKCYNIKTPGSASPSTLTLQDGFFPSGETVHISAPPSVLCTPTVATMPQ